jgi:ketosteroid isomerase-like protein
MNRIAMTLLVVAAGCAATREQPEADTFATVRAQLERRYEENNAAYVREDLAAILALRAPDFHTVGPDGSQRDYAAMAQYIEGFLNGVEQWNSLSITIDSLTVRGDTAFVETSQHLDRMALRPDNAVHHVETWVKQREIWIRRDGEWYLWRVDNLRDQRREIDGQPG